MSAAAWCASRSPARRRARGEHAAPVTGGVDAALAVAARAAWYAGGLGAAGLAVIGCAAGAWLSGADAAWLGRLCRRAAWLGIAAALAGFVLQVAQLAGGGPLRDAELWGMALAAPGGLALGLGLAGCWGLIVIRRAAPRAAAGLLVCASLAAAGHGSTLGLGGQALVLLHVAAVAAWIGSLPLLARIACRGTPRAAGWLAGWGRAALPGVALLAATGFGLGAWLLGDAAALPGSGYGRALLAKLALVAALLVLAARHRWRLVPRLAAGDAASGPRLARSIAWQGGLALAILVLVALLTGGVFGPPPAVR